MREILKVFVVNHLLWQDKVVFTILKLRISEVTTLSIKKAGCENYLFIYNLFNEFRRKVEGSESNINLLPESGNFLSFGAFSNRNERFRFQHLYDRAMRHPDLGHDQLRKENRRMR